MRLVTEPADFHAALDSARREAQASFADPACLIEKFIQSPRHIEIQVFGDDHGNVVHLFERDCSLQRRHQKVIEEAPAPGMTSAMREAMGNAAVKAAQSIGYSGAGTVEFIVDGSEGLLPDRFWFMEMNTRLQVEHPVTEMITGVDLVEWQLRVASGETLPQQQDQLEINGWAFEARLYAEDAAREFMPATGTLDHLQFPAAARIDTGVREGDTITPFYDPMIAKLTTHGVSRDAALNQLAAALRTTHVAGSVTNVEFLYRLCRHPLFAGGQVDTGLIEREADGLTATASPSPSVIAMAATAVSLRSQSDATCAQPEEAQASSRVLPPDDTHVGFTLWAPMFQRICIECEGVTYPVDVATTGKGKFLVRFGEIAVGDIAVADSAGDTQLQGETELRLHSDGRISIDGHQIDAYLISHRSGVSVFHDGAWHFQLPDPLAAADVSAASGTDSVTAPMSGQIKVVSATDGQQVSIGDAIIVMEAMKMEHTLAAPRDGIIDQILVSNGDQVDEGAQLFCMKSDDAENE